MNSFSEETLSNLIIEEEYSTDSEGYFMPRTPRGNMYQACITLIKFTSSFGATSEIHFPLRIELGTSTNKTIW